MAEVTLGGDRLGSGKKQTVQLRNYERSTHDLGFIWRSTMASGTLTPFMSEVALPGDSFDINLNCDIKTHPTIGPLFGSYKVQLDVFQCPVRLYNGKLHMNLLNIGLKMSDIKLPQIVLKAKGDAETYGDNAQINPSSIFSYLNIRGIGISNDDSNIVTREFNAIPYLAYFDIYKQYYANKQEEIGVIVHNAQDVIANDIVSYTIKAADSTLVLTTDGSTSDTLTIDAFSYAEIEFEVEEPNNLDEIVTYAGPDGTATPQLLSDLWQTLTYNAITKTLTCTDPTPEFIGEIKYVKYTYSGANIPPGDKPQLYQFPLENIDTMRKQILVDTMNPNPYLINTDSIEPYNLPLLQGDVSDNAYCKLKPMEGLLIKTYQSDLFNNWISTEWIDGDNGINSITAVDTSGGEFTLDTLQLSRKVYDMLNRIAVSGGSYDDWLEAVYTHERTRSVENPIYLGGLSKELGFQEVVSTSATDVNAEQPLGTLAGRGVLNGKHKGGSIRVSVDEPSYIMGIISLTPRVDYSQGNKWDTNLKTMDDFHKPALDEIGFQDLITDQMAWFDTRIDRDRVVTYKSAGKQPAWINYMTNVNQVRGNFAEKGEQMFMTLNRRYDQTEEGIGDLTTYVDPSKFNHIFADTRLDAQNFWAQIGVDITARRKMSARLMPNL